MANGKYIGIDSTINNGVRVEAVNSPYLWNIYSENKADIYSLRPSTNTKIVVNGYGENNSDGTHIILWTYTVLIPPIMRNFALFQSNSIDKSYLLLENFILHIQFGFHPFLS